MAIAQRRRRVHFADPRRRSPAAGRSSGSAPNAWSASRRKTAGSLGLSVPRDNGHELLAAGRHRRDARAALVELRVPERRCSKSAATRRAKRSGRTIASRINSTRRCCATVTCTASTKRSWRASIQDRRVKWKGGRYGYGQTAAGRRHIDRLDRGRRSGAGEGDAGSTSRNRAIRGH